MKHLHAARLDRMIRYGIITDPERCDIAHGLLCRIDASVMSQEDVAKRWPRIVAALIVESLGYFTPRSAANAVLSHKLKRAYGCEYYCFSAGFERDGWPKDPKEYDGKLRTTGRQKLMAATGCKQYEGLYDRCVDCSLYRYEHKGMAHEFIMAATDHQGCRHSRYTGRDSERLYSKVEYRYALELVRAMAAGDANPPALLASWF